MKRLTLFSVAVGLILWAGFDLPNIVTLIIGATGLYWLALKEVKDLAQALLFGTVAGTTYALGFLAWHWTVLPLDWAGVTNNFFGSILIFYSWFLPALLIGISIGAWLAAIFLLKDKKGWLVLWGPLLWVLFEFLRSIDISLLWMGTGGTVGPVWTLGFLGYALAEWPALLWWAGWGGVYILSFLVMLAGYLIYSRKIVLIAIFIAVIGLSVWWPTTARVKTTVSIPVAVVTTNMESFSRINSSDMESLRERKMHLVEAVDKITPVPEVAIFPEDSRVRLDAAGLPKNPKIIIDSARVLDSTGLTGLEFQYLNNSSGQTATSGKSFLVPHGEYMPYITDLLGGVIGRSDWVKNFRAIRGTVATSPGQVLDLDGLKLQSTACSEVMLPGLYAKQANEGVDFLINAASHSLFRGSRQLYGQTMRMAQVRAAESGRALVESSNFVPSFLISPRGEVLWQSEWGSEGVNLVQIPVSKKATFYSYLAALF